MAFIAEGLQDASALLWQKDNLRLLLCNGSWNEFEASTLLALTTEIGSTRPAPSSVVSSYNSASNSQSIDLQWASYTPSADMTVTHIGVFRGASPSASSIGRIPATYANQIVTLSLSPASAGIGVGTKVYMLGSDNVRYERTVNAINGNALSIATLPANVTISAISAASSVLYVTRQLPSPVAMTAGTSYVLTLNGVSYGL